MACPFFIPTHRMETELWRFRERLPLGDGWGGCCAAPGHGGAVPGEDEVRDFCNLGYALDCWRLPRQRACDAVRFGVARDRNHRIEISWVRESGHRPVDHGTLQYDASAHRWGRAHPDGRVQKLAECYLQSYLSRKGRGAASSLASA